MNKRLLSLSFLLCLLCIASWAQEKLIVVNKGTWQSDNGRLSYFENGSVVSNQWFRDVNGAKLGDTPCDIVQVRPNVIAIALNGSNIVQFIDATGHALGESGEVANVSRLATDGDYVYATSYAHECSTEKGLKKFTKGFVAKIDAATYKVVDAMETGYEPEGIAVYDGKLFVANSGGYSFQENHDYERTVTVADAATMTTMRTIDTGQANLYGKIAQSGQYLCINSPGDYYEMAAATIILDCQAALDGKPDAQCAAKLNYASTYTTTAANGDFYAIGSVFSYITYGYEYNFLTIKPEQAFKSGGAIGVSSTLPGTVAADIKKMSTPNGLYLNPYTSYIYATDAGNFTESGYLYQWTPAGTYVNKYKVYIDPSSFLALNPQGEAGIGSALTDQTEDPDAPMYNLQGIRIYTPAPGQIYIQNGKKKIQR
ncbi:MAG: hypothetical protein NC548_58910 [Lachnospiraceae bacterium]|nr:hypothetical protein [Lachnospiraceae bacterium]